MRKIKVFRKSNVKVANRKRRLKIAFRSAVTLLVLVIAFFGLRQVGMHLDSLKINHIEVTGLEAPLTSQKIVSESGLKVGMPVFGVEPAHVPQFIPKVPHRPHLVFRKWYFPPLAITKEQSHSQCVCSILLNQIDRIDYIPLTLAHLLAFPVHDRRPQVHVLKWNFPSNIESKHHHSRDPDL